MSPPSIWKLPPKHSHFAETRSISLMPAAGTRIPLIERKGYLRSPIRNEIEHSAKKILAECSTRWPSAQYFRSIIQPNYHIYHWGRLNSSKKCASATAIRKSIFSAPHSDGGVSRHRHPLACDEFIDYYANYLWSTCHSGIVYDLACRSSFNHPDKTTSRRSAESH